MRSPSWLCSRLFTLLALQTAERIGALNIVCRDAATAEAVKSQLKVLIRPMYSNPPLHGARLVSKILGDKSLYNEWYGVMTFLSRSIDINMS
jgi:aspartate/tyrosine/aromatic aminotransferase